MEKIIKLIVNILSCLSCGDLKRNLYFYDCIKSFEKPDFEIFFFLSNKKLFIKTGIIELKLMQIVKSSEHNFILINKIFFRKLIFELNVLLF